MKIYLRRATHVALLSVLAAIPALAQSEKDMIMSAESAAPLAVSSEATIYTVGADGSMKTLREGTNGWWCLPDNPASPGPDPMCGDANSMDWAAAWIGKTEPPAGKVGFIYMLAGGSDASNTDPYAEGPENASDWIAIGAHVMIMNATALMSGYPAGADPDPSTPFVMWAGTPYAHLMVPVE